MTRGRDHRHLRERVRACGFPPNPPGGSKRFRDLHSQFLPSCQTAGDDHVGRSYDHLSHLAAGRCPFPPLNSGSGRGAPALRVGCSRATARFETMRTPERACSKNGSGIRVYLRWSAERSTHIAERVRERTPGNRCRPTASRTMGRRCRYGNTDRTDISSARTKVLISGVVCARFWATTTARVTANARATPSPRTAGTAG